MPNNPSKKPIEFSLTNILPILFFMGRMILFLAFIPDGLHGFGDFPIYFDVAALPGLPYFQYWSEYPPLYAWTIELIYLISQGNQFLFDFILYLLLTIAGSISIWLVAEISRMLSSNEKQTHMRVTLYVGFLAFTSYSWWYFDLILVAMMLAAIYYLLKEPETTAGIWVGLGILTKWFPILLLPVIFRFRKWKTFLRITLIAIGLTVLVWGIHYALSPTMALASLQSQPSRSSWQTLWALIDGNMTTGAFVPVEERIWSEAATFQRGNPAVIPSWATLIVFGAIGLWLLFKIDPQKKETLIPMVGITWALFLLWSPGWSPQWILYLLPLICLSLPIQKALMLTFLLFFVTFIEWPFLLTHHFFEGLWVIVPIRIVLFFLLIISWNQGSKSKPSTEEV
jgi:hypothetical protein